MIAIEIQLLLDRLEAVLNESRQLPFAVGVLVDRDRCYDIINQLRVAIPQEVKTAQRMQQERERIIAQAKEEAERIVMLAREHAQQIVEQAQLDAKALKRDALLYTAELLEDMERQFSETVQKIKRGREFLETEVTQEIQENLAGVDQVEDQSSAQVKQETGNE